MDCEYLLVHTIVISSHLALTLARSITHIFCTCKEAISSQSTLPCSYPQLWFCHHCFLPSWVVEPLHLFLSTIQRVTCYKGINFNQWLWPHCKALGFHQQRKLEPITILLRLQTTILMIKAQVNNMGNIICIWTVGKHVYNIRDYHWQLCSCTQVISSWYGHVLNYSLTIALAKDVLEVLRSKPKRL